jgi:hypothetical protein
MTDIEFVKKILPDSYTVKESNKPGSIHCVSKTGIINKNILFDDVEDEDHWEYIFKAIKQHFGERFQEVYHNVCFLHKNFTIYLKK